MEEPVKLVSIYSLSNMLEVHGQLYAMLAKRPPIANISHKEMPTFEQHCKYVEGMPYAEWDLIGEPVGPVLAWVGQIYLTRRNEIGIQILKPYQQRGYATSAVRQLMSKRPGPYYANTNPRNRASIVLFKKMGFQIIQSTYKLDAQAGAQL
jgi:RimJ/RimL family protein N-acetyltransferase